MIRKKKRKKENENKLKLAVSFHFVILLSGHSSLKAETHLFHILQCMKINVEFAL